MDAADRGRRRLLRYALFQIPGLVLVAAALALLVTYRDWSLALAGAVLAAWVVKDAVLYRFVGLAYEPDSEPADPLIGASGVVTEALDPSGYVRVGAELWRAVAARGSPPIPPGAPVRVRKRRDLTLVVEEPGGPD